jgi:hypothetical protein
LLRDRRSLRRRRRRLGAHCGGLLLVLEFQLPLMHDIRLPAGVHLEIVALRLGGIRVALPGSHFFPCMIR